MRETQKRKGRGDEVSSARKDVFLMVNETCPAYPESGAPGNCPFRGCGVPARGGAR